MEDCSTDGSDANGGGLLRTVSFGVSATVWGHLALAASGGEVVAAAPGPDRRTALRELGKTVGLEVTLDGSVDEFVSSVVALLESGASPAGVPVKASGTAFQLEVWEALRDLPSGRLISYSEIAAAIGRPGAVRAVASACAANRIGIFIPCHRVIRSDGSIGGYRWGEALKHRIIETESAPGPDSSQADDETVLRAA